MTTQVSPVEHLRSYEGALERSFPAAEIPLPALVGTEGEHLWWSVSRKGRPKTTRPARGMLEQFVGLHKEPDSAIETFARRWGTLQLCERHLLPSTHDTRPRSFSVLSGASVITATLIRKGESISEARRIAGLLSDAWPKDTACAPAGRYDRDRSRAPGPDAEEWEPLWGWRGFSRQAQAILSIAVNLNEGRTGKRDDWQDVYV